MIENINGVCFRNMLDYGARNLDKHCKLINQLNVFPVPDGDTGTNMVTTIKKGLRSIDETAQDLSTVAKTFAKSIIFGARGNSGVIVSQFLKGISEGFFEVETANARTLIHALERGVACAHTAVANPVEGTMLTVIKDATEAVKDKSESKNIDEVIDSFIEHAKVSLENTPELLPTLKEAGVVDSGGAGIVYFFEGIKKYLDGEELDAGEAEAEESEQVDYSAFNMDSRFEYGYCTELLIQLLNGKEPFDYEDFRAKLQAMGDSVVTTRDNDKLRIHVHTKLPEEVFAFCHRYGEFLSLKVENMTVQHTTEATKNILCSPNKNKGAFSVVAVAYDRALQKLFLEMGADVVIYCEKNASPKDYLDAFEQVSTESIIVFPNNSDSILTAIQAKKLYKKGSVVVINSRGVSECYASLPIIDFAETDVEKIEDTVTKTINNVYSVSVSYRNKSIYYAFSGKEILVIGKTLEETVLHTIEKTLEKHDKSIITIFHGRGVTEEQLASMTDSVATLGICAEIFTVPTDREGSDLTISFE